MSIWYDIKLKCLIEIIRSSWMKSYFGVEYDYWPSMLRHLIANKPPYIVMSTL